uniref:Uncharacterized protein n=1 Tax=Opuntia streptacantha TaxID=393608 RepID=A0A7C9DQ30_OPUST
MAARPTHRPLRSISTATLTTFHPRPPKPRRFRLFATKEWQLQVKRLYERCWYSWVLARTASSHLEISPSDPLEFCGSLFLRQIARHSFSSICRYLVTEPKAKLSTDTKLGPAKSKITPSSLHMPTWPMKGISHERRGRGVHTMQHGNRSLSGSICLGCR